MIVLEKFKKKPGHWSRVHCGRGGNSRVVVGGGRVGSGMGG